MRDHPLTTDARRTGLLIVPGLHNSGPGHWQSLWEDRLPDCQRVELGLWDRPHRNTWVNNLNLAIRAANRPVILVAHSLGCLAVAWWAALERPARGGAVRGALLVAPPRVDREPLDPRLSGFAPAPKEAMPFPAIVVGSRNDPYITQPEARQLARDWGCGFADAGSVGHINGESGLGDWPFGQVLLAQLVRAAERGGPDPGRAAHPAAATPMPLPPAAIGAHRAPPR